jgi:hypothetical protein
LEAEEQIGFFSEETDRVEGREVALRNWDSELKLSKIIQGQVHLRPGGGDGSGVGQRNRTDSH